MDQEMDDLLYCQWHPKVETTLRCYQCETPICVKCARRTPVGYLCPDCQRGHKQRFVQTRPADYVIAGVISVVLGGIAGMLPLLGSWWFLLFLSPLAGSLIAEVVWRAVGRRFGPHLWWIVGTGIVVGSLPVFGIGLLRLLAAPQGSLWGLQGLFVWGVHIVLAVGAAVTRLRFT
jgi:hypothetical protein